METVCAAVSECGGTGGRDQHSIGTGEGKTTAGHRVFRWYFPILQWMVDMKVRK